MAGGFLTPSISRPHLPDWRSRPELEHPGTPPMICRSRKLARLQSY